MRRLLATIAVALGLSVPAFAVGTAQAVTCHAYTYRASNPDKGGGFCDSGGYYVFIWCLNSIGNSYAVRGPNASGLNYSWATCPGSYPNIQTARMIPL